MVVNFNKAGPVQLQTLKPGEEFEYMGAQYIRMVGEYHNPKNTNILAMRKQNFTAVSFHIDTEVRPVNANGLRKRCVLEDLKLGETFQMEDKEESPVFIKTCMSYINDYDREVVEIYGVNIQTGGSTPLGDTLIVYPIETTVTVG